MMILRLKQIISAFLLLGMSLVAYPQDLPVLPADPAIKTGRLPNGTHYYLVSNPTIKGVADFALIQKTGTGNIPDSLSGKVVETARKALAGLPRCLAPSLQEYVTSHGVTPGRDGFVKVSENATEFRFRDVLLDKPSTLDSTLLVLMDVIDRVSTADDPFLRKWYSPSDQAVIVSGDIDVAAVEYKLQMLSMMTPSTESVPRVRYVWESRDSAEYVRRPASRPGLAEISVAWRSARMPSEYMNTVQPTIYEMFLAELGMVVEEKVFSSLRSKNIPLAGVSCGFVTSVQSADDESFSVSLSVAPEHFTEALTSLSDVLSGVDAGMTSAEDLARVKRICTDMVHEASNMPVRSNSAYVDKCMTAFLYNGSLATLKSKVDFLASRKLADTTELRLFNGISSALLDPERNMTLTYDAPMPEDSVRMVFDEAWMSQKDTVERHVYTMADVPVIQPFVPKLKIRGTKTDPMSKGQVWTFSNGMTVVYRKMDTRGRLYYNLARNGGYGSIEDLERGEGGYLSDYLLLGRIGDMTGEEFIKMLNREGITMESYVGLSYMMLSGYAPNDKADHMMRALLAIVNARTPDLEAYRYHADCLRLEHLAAKGTRQERACVIDSIMCPDYRFTAMRGLADIPDALPAKADKYFAGQAGKNNDGVLILLGDMDEAELKKVLLEHMGGFKTTEKAFRRPLVRYQPLSGWSTYTVASEHDGVDIVMSAPLTLSIDNYMASEIAAMVLQKHLSEAVIDTGMFLTLESECRIYPNERFEIRLSLNEASPMGFSSYTEPTGPIKALAIVREALESISETPVPDSEVEAFKQQLKGRMALDMKDPFYWLNVISRRYLAGKDFTTNYESKISSVTPDKVRAILSALNDGSKVEYIISGN